jgi:hypothetical protein
MQNTQPADDITGRVRDDFDITEVRSDLGLERIERLKKAVLDMALNRVDGREDLYVGG